MQAGCRLTSIAIKNIHKVQVGCRLDTGWMQADVYQHKKLLKSAGWSAGWVQTGFFLHKQLFKSARWSAGWMQADFSQYKLLSESSDCSEKVRPGSGWNLQFGIFIKSGWL